MLNFNNNDMKSHFEKNGFYVIGGVFEQAEIATIVNGIDSSVDKPTFRKTKDMFAIRQFLKEFPKMCTIIFNENLRQIIESFGSGYFVVKSIYFDKPGQSNWFVAYHQDLTISVAERVEQPGYGPWTVKQDQFAVQPPLNILQDNFTIRIHLDDATEDNGALKVIPGSHLKGIYRPQDIDWTIERKVFCNVLAGGVMLMSPLLLHASNRTVNNQSRKVIHVEFSRATLPEGLRWSERINIKS